MMQKTNYANTKMEKTTSERKNDISNIYEIAKDDGSELSVMEECEKQIEGEIALWRAVITQSLMDAGSMSKKREMKYDKAQAISWLSGSSSDFQEICILADMNPDYVREKAKLAMKKGCTWRNDNPFKKIEKKNKIKRLIDLKNVKKRNVA